ncbi:hypothetical protein AQUCO_07200046v1 [Aquilegia coerulea]|uniref:F-box domain-containing protein n=1 Tax=Aquilegia coerulea TaxID=218851 RepID=A0A2G5CA44_AQUCA|nr:hypothetical protein AQUCO_07200046v1 [Aquilegia coerulea]
MEILSLLPVKSLLRFRCVCKSWNQLLRDPYFIQLHLNLHQSIKTNNNHHLNSDTQFLFLTDSQGITDFHCALDYNACHKAMKLYLPVKRILRGHYCYKVFGICNGLVCLANLSGSLKVHVWNPLIRDHITIPSSPIPSVYPDYERHGFGFLHDTNEYKLIRIVCTPEFKCSEPHEYSSHVSVYTLGTDSWRTLEPISYRLCEGSGALINEALHWLAARPTDSLSWSSILSFDLKDEVFQEIPQPNGFEDYHCSHYVKVGELYGLLCIFCILPREDVQIWVMKEYGVVDSWTKQFKIERPKVRYCPYSLQPLGLANNGEIILQKDMWQLFSYNPKTNSLTSLKKFLLKFDQVYAFVGSLMSPSSFNGVLANH